MCGNPFQQSNTRTGEKKSRQCRVLLPWQWGPTLAQPELCILVFPHDGHVGDRLSDLTSK